MATNISNIMGGRAKLWEDSGKRVGINDPYGKSFKRENKPKFKHLSYNDDILEFNSFNFVIDIGLGKSNKLAQEKGPLEIKYREKVRISL